MSEVIPINGVNLNCEEDFRKHVMKVAEAANFHVSWVEAHLSAAGIPDLNVYRNGVDVWLELKVIKDGYVRMRPTQKRWHKDRAAKGGKSWVLALNRVTGDILVIPGNIAADLDGRVHGWSDHSESWNVFALGQLLNDLSKRNNA